MQCGANLSTHDCIRPLTFMFLRFWKYLLAFFDDTYMKKINIVHAMHMKYEGTASKQLASLWWLTRFQGSRCVG